MEKNVSKDDLILVLFGIGILFVLTILFTEARIRDTESLINQRCEVSSAN